MGKIYAGEGRNTYHFDTAKGTPPIGRQKREWNGREVDLGPEIPISVTICRGAGLKIPA
jgi:hypothetical protein